MKNIIAVALAALTLAVPAASAKGKLSADISIASQAAGSVTFSVEQTGGKDSDYYSLWVANRCYGSDGVQVSVEYQAVANMGSFSDSFAGAAYCVAMVTEFPDVWTPIAGNSEVTYTP